MYTSTQRGTSGISSGSIDALRVQLMKMNSQQLQAFATANQDDAIKLSLAAEADKYRKQHGQEAMAMMAGQQQKPPISQQILQSIGQPPQQPQQPMPQQGQMPPQGMPPQQMAQAPQEMPPQQMADGGYVLPEDQGIATLPVGGMDFAEGGIVGYAGGGEVPGYAEGVFTGVKKKYKELRGYEFDGGPEMFDKALDAEGVTDIKKRAFLKAIHDKESNQARIAPTREGSDAAGPMQVRPGAWTDVSKKGEELKDRNNSYDNMRAGIRYASMGWEKAKGDPALASTFYYGGKGGFDKAKENKGVAANEDKGQTTLQYGKDVASRYFKILPITATAAPAVANSAIDQIPGQSAKAPPSKTALQDQGLAALAGGDPMTGFTMPQDVFSPSPEEERKYAAAKVQAKKVEDVVSQIPGQTAKAPAFKDTNTYFGGVADRMDIPQEVQRNVANTINATSGFTAPIGGVNRAAATVSKGFEPTAEMIQKAAQAKLLTTSDLTNKIVEAPRLLPPTKAGLEVLDEASAATRAAAEQARRMRLLEQDRKAAIGAEQSVDAATKSAAIADKFAKEQAMLVDAARLGQAKMTGAAQGLAMTQAADKAGLIPQGGGVSDLIPETAPAMAPPIPSGMLAPVAGEEPKGLDVKDLPKDPVTGGTDWNKLATYFGLNLMAGKSPNALTNVGEAGIGALNMQQAEAKANSEKAYREALAAQAKMPSGEVQMYEKYANDPKFRKAVDMMAAAKREPVTRETLFKEYIKSPVASIKSFSEYVSEYEKEFGSLGGGAPKGVIVSREK